VVPIFRPSPGGLRSRPPTHRLLRQTVLGAAFLTLCAVLLGLGLFGSQAKSDGARQSGLGPTLGPSQVVERDDVGDPFVLTVSQSVAGTSKASYVLYWTTDWRSNVPTAVSSDLIHWHRVADALPVLPSWATPSKTLTWGPTVHRVGSHWVLYYSTRDAATGRECIGRGTSTSPVGPFSDTATAPLVCQPTLGGDIDPSVVTTSAGVSSLLWKNDGNAVHGPVGIWEQPLAADGLSMTSTPKLILSADQAWEHGIIEGPTMLAGSQGGWWLFFSGGSWQSGNYDTGVAWCAQISGPCHKATSPMLTSTAKAVSPGGFDTFTAADGKLWASYSAFPELPANARAAMAENRVLEIAPVLSH
jgi:beta-xylosidase